MNNNNNFCVAQASHCLFLFSKIKKAPHKANFVRSLSGENLQHLKVITKQL